MAKIAVLGAGNIGGTLGAKWVKAGRAVTFGVRDPHSAKTQASLKVAAGASVETMERAIAFGEVVVFTIPGAAMQAFVESHAAALDGKVLVDTTNKISEPVMNSLGLLAALAPQARLYRAFNSLGWENFAEPVFQGIHADLFYCGHDDPQSRPLVEGLIRDVGLDPVYVGGLEQAPVVDSVVRLWITLAVGQKMGRHLAFKVLKP